MDNKLKQIANAKEDLLIERKINIQINKDMHKYATDVAKWGIVCDILEDKIWGKKQIKFKKQTIKHKGDKNVMYIIGDIHYRGKQDNGQIDELFRSIADDINSHKYTDVTFLLTGDNVDGEIHTEQQRTNSPVVEASYDFINAFSEWVRWINANFNDVIKNIYMVYGNHEEMRLWGDKGTENNIGKLIGLGLKLALPNVYIEHGKELLIRYNDKQILLLHGHQRFAKNKAELINHCNVKYGCQPEAIILGHFHSFKVNQFNKDHWLIVAPAVKNWASTWDEDQGYCGFGQYIKFKMNYRTPQINIKEVV